jgi:DNA-binding transcriptional ArsR family regulator
VTDEEIEAALRGALAHPVRAALVALLRERGTVTATEAAAALGHSSGLCSFHLRQLARYGYVTEAGPARGRVRPWRLATPAEPEPAGFGALARELEDEGYQRWLRHRDRADPVWRRDEAFSAVVFLTPDELHEVADQVRALLARYADRERHADLRPAAARPVAAVTRLFPLLPEE